MIRIVGDIQACAALTATSVRRDAFAIAKPIAEPIASAASIFSWAMHPPRSTQLERETNLRADQLFVFVEFRRSRSRRISLAAATATSLMNAERERASASASARIRFKSSGKNQT